MAISCEPNDLLEAAKCFKCIPVGEQMAVQIYLLQQIAENTMTVDELLAAAKCFKCIPQGAQAEIRNYLLCQIVNAL